MIKPAHLSKEIQSLLMPRSGLQWAERTRIFSSPWARPILIENAASRAFYALVLEQEKSERLIIHDQIEGALRALPSDLFRFWIAEYNFMTGILSSEQLTIYAPAFVQLAFTMPKKLVFFRRLVVRRYLSTILLEEAGFIERQRKKFIRSSILLYPSSLLIQMSDRLVKLVNSSRDQSVTANRKRVIMCVRALQIMSNLEICDRFKTEEEYLTELEFLQAQCRHFRIEVSEIYNISGAELRQFWSI